MVSEVAFFQPVLAIRLILPAHSLGRDKEKKHAGELPLLETLTQALTVTFGRLFKLMASKAIYPSAK